MQVGFDFTVSFSVIGVSIKNKNPRKTHKKAVFGEFSFQLFVELIRFLSRLAFLLRGACKAGALEIRGLLFYFFFLLRLIEGLHCRECVTISI